MTPLNYLSSLFSFSYYNYSIFFLLSVLKYLYLLSLPFFFSVFGERLHLPKSGMTLLNFPV